MSAYVADTVPLINTKDIPQGLDFFLYHTGMYGDVKILATVPFPNMADTILRSQEGFHVSGPFLSVII